MPDARAQEPGGGRDAVVVDTQRRFAGEHRATVLTAAAELFDTAGYHNTSLASIAERADMTKAAVLELFRVKHDILHAIHDNWIDELLAMAARHDHPGDAYCDALRAYINDILTVIERRPSQVRVYFEYYRDLPPDLQKHAKAKRDIYEAQVEGVIRRGMEAAVFRRQNARVATFGLFGMCNWTYQWYRAAGALSAHEIAVQFSEVYLRGLCTRPEDASED